jgi:hypothetical protein
MECFDAMITEFFERGDARELDTACVEKMKRLPFLLSEKPASPPAGK